MVADWTRSKTSVLSPLASNADVPPNEFPSQNVLYLTMNRWKEDYTQSWKKYVMGTETPTSEAEPTRWWEREYVQMLAFITSMSLLAGLVTLVIVKYGL